MIVVEELELKVRATADLIIASLHYFPVGFKLERVRDLVTTSDVQVKSRWSAAQVVAALVAARVQLSPYEVRLDRGGAGSQLASDLVQVAPLPTSWMINPALAAGIGIAPAPRSADEREALVAAGVHKLSQFEELAEEQNLDPVGVAHELGLGQDSDLYLVFIHTLRTHLSGLEREARREPIPEWALQAVKDANAAKAEELRRDST